MAARLRIVLKTVTNKLFGKYLLVTNVVGASCMLAVGNTIEQRVVKRVLKGDKVKDQDWDRTGRMSLAGVTMGTVTHFWYGWLDRRFPGTAVRKFAAKMALDTAMGIPLTNIPLFFTIGLLEGMSAKESAHNAIVKFPPILVGELVFWGPAQAVNFYFLPPRFRVMYLGVVNIFWTSFISYVQFEYGNTEIKKLPSTQSM